MVAPIPKPNFESVNYNLRAAKNVERKMLCEAFNRLTVLDDLKNYRYIGFGSAYFTDFNLFHKNLGITKLLSIEKEDARQYKNRIDFNKPFSCIDILYGESSSLLPRLDWQKWKKTMVWLDYTSKLTASILGDIHTVFSMIKPGSIFLVSVNVEQDSYNPNTGLELKPWRLSMLEKRIDKKNVPSRANGLLLNSNDNKSIIREVIDNNINNALSTRNGGSRRDYKLHYKQLFNFYYKDGAAMLTIGGIIYNEAQAGRVNKMFENIEFIRDGDDCFDIRVPNLTYREIHALDKLLPSSSNKQIMKKIPLSADDITNYKNIYRYFPNFTEVNL
jgi:hypothetical protein